MNRISQFKNMITKKPPPYVILFSYQKTCFQLQDHHHPMGLEFQKETGKAKNDPEKNI